MLTTIQKGVLACYRLDRFASTREIEKKVWGKESALHEEKVRQVRNNLRKKGLIMVNPIPCRVEVIVL